jgi:hypothetical protein
MAVDSANVKIKGARIYLDGVRVGEIIGSRDYSGGFIRGGYRVELTIDGVVYTTATRERPDTFAFFRDAAKFARAALANPAGTVDALRFMRACDVESRHGCKGVN